MAKPLLLKVLRDTFGEYVSGLNSENLRIGVWSGEIELTNLKIKPEAFHSLGLPIHIHVGIIQSLHVSIPWTRLGSEPVKITISGVTGLASLSSSPSNDNNNSSSSGNGNADGDGESVSVGMDHYSMKKLAEKRRAIKWADALEIQQERESAQESAASNSESNDNSSEIQGSNENEEGFMARLASKVMDNLQITIKHGHLRIEDRDKWTGKTFAFGVMFREFIACACNIHGDVEFINRGQNLKQFDIIHRLVKLSDFAIYWDHIQSSSSPLPSPLSTSIITGAGHGRNDSFLSTRLIGESQTDYESRVVYNLIDVEFGTLSNDMATNRYDDNELLELERARTEVSLRRHNFLLEFCSPTMIVSKNELFSATNTPRYNLQVKLNGIKVVISRQQYEDVLALHFEIYRYYRDIKSDLQFRKPASTILQNPRAWWKYYIEKVRQKTDKRRKIDLIKLWQNISFRTLKREKYSSLYRRHILQNYGSKPGVPSFKPLTNGERQFMGVLEDELELNDILAFRATTRAELKAEIRKRASSVSSYQNNQSNEQRPGVTGWLKSWVASSSNSADDNFVGNDGLDGTLTAQERAEILDAISYVDAVKQHHVPEGTLFTVVHSNLENASISLLDINSKLIFRTHIAGEYYLETCVGPTSRMRLTLHHFDLWDYSANVHEPHKIIWHSKDSIITTASPRTAVVGSNPFSSSLSSSSLIGNTNLSESQKNLAISNVNNNDQIIQNIVAHISVEMKPPKAVQDVSVVAAIVPFKVYFSPHWVDSFIRFFDVPSASRFGETAAGAISSWGETRQRNFMEALARRALVAVRIDISSPVFALPIDAAILPSTKTATAKKLLVFDFGHLSIETDDNRLPDDWISQSPFYSSLLSDIERRKIDPVSPDLLEQNERKQSATNDIAFDAWRVSLKSVRAILLSNSEKWSTIFDSIQKADNQTVLSNQRQDSEILGTHYHHVIQEFDLNARVAVCVAPKQLEISKSRVHIEISQLKLHVLPTLLVYLKHLSRSWAFVGRSTANNPYDQNSLTIENEPSNATTETPPSIVDMTISVDTFKMLISKAKLVESAEGIMLLPTEPLMDFLFRDFYCKIDRTETASSGTLGLGSFEVVDLTHFGVKDIFASSLVDVTLPKSHHDVYKRQDVSEDGGLVSLKFYFPVRSILQKKFQHQQSDSADSSSGNDVKKLRREEIQVEFSKLHLNWNPETVVTIQDALSEFTGLKPQLDPNPSQTTLPLAVQPIPTPATMTATVETSSAISEQSEEELRKVEINLASLSIAFTKRSKKYGKRILALGVLSNAKFTHILYSSKNSNLAGSLGNLCLIRPPVQKSVSANNDSVKKRLNLDPPQSEMKTQEKKAHKMRKKKSVNRTFNASAYSDLFSVVAGESSLLIFRFESFAKPKLFNDTYFQSDLYIEISPAKLIYLHQVWLEIHDYANEGVLGAVLMNLTYNASGILMNTDTTSKNRYRVSFIKPFFMLPVSEYTEDLPFGIGATCDKFDFTNSYISANDLKENVLSILSEYGTQDSRMVRRLIYSAKNLMIHSFDRLKNGSYGQQAVCQMLDEHVQLSIFADSPHGLQPREKSFLKSGFDMLVSGRISPIRIQLPRSSYFLFFDMLRGNILAELADVGNSNNDTTTVEPYSSSYNTSSSELAIEIPNNHEDSQSDLLNRSQSANSGRISSSPGLGVGEVKTKATEAPDQPLVVHYGYDKTDEPPSKFLISILFETASISIKEDHQRRIADFAMNLCTLGFERGEDQITVMTLDVKHIDLVDSRDKSKANNYFRHLVLSDAKLSSNEEHDDGSAFKVRYVSFNQDVKLEFFDVRGIVMIELLWDVIQFIITTYRDSNSPNNIIRTVEITDKILTITREDDENGEGIGNERASIVDVENESKPWNGSFTFTKLCLIFVADFTNPNSDAFALCGDLDLKWNLTGDRLSSTWTGEVNNIEAYRAYFFENKLYHLNSADGLEAENDIASQPTSSDKHVIPDIKILREALTNYRIGNQLFEPTKLNFKYTHDCMSSDMKIHTRRREFYLSQLETFLSISDVFALIQIIQTLQQSDNPTSKQGLGTSSEGSNNSIGGIHDIDHLASSPMIMNIDETLIMTDRWTRLLSTCTLPENDEDDGEADAIDDDIEMAIDAEHESADVESSERKMTVELEIKEGKFAVEFNNFDVGFTVSDKSGFVTVETIDATKEAYLKGVIPGDCIYTIGGVMAVDKNVSTIYSMLNEFSRPLEIIFHCQDTQDALITKDSLDLRSGAIVMNVIDDVKGRDMPLIYFSFPGLDIFSNGSSVGTSVFGAQLLVAIHYYSYVSNHWKLLLDPWKFSFTVSFHQNGEKEVVIESSSPLQFKISKYFMSVYMDAMRRATYESLSKMKSIQDDTSQSSLTQNPPALQLSATAASFSIRNETFHDLVVWLPSESNNSNFDLSNFTRVRTQDSLDFSIPHRKGDGSGFRRTYIDQEKMLVGLWPFVDDDKGASIVKQGKLNEEMLTAENWTVQINRIHWGIVDVTKGVSQNLIGQKLLWDIKYEDGRLCCTFRSLRAVQNNLDVAVSVLANNPSWKSGPRIISAPIPPKTTQYLPLTVGDATELRFKPFVDQLLVDINEPTLSNASLSGIATSWSDACYVPPPGSGGFSAFNRVQCRNIDQSIPPFYMIVYSQVSKMDMMTVTFKIGPPLTIVNLLPAPILTERKVKSESVGDPIRVPPGNSQQVFDLGLQGKYNYIFFRLTNSEWSQKVEVNSKILKIMNAMVPSKVNKDNNAYFDDDDDGDGIVKANKLDNRERSQFDSASSSAAASASSSLISGLFGSSGDGEVSIPEDMSSSSSKMDEDEGIEVIQVKDGDGNTIPISILQEASNDGGVKFTLYCSYWIVNHTGLPLSFGLESGIIPESFFFGFSDNSSSAVPGWRKSTGDSSSPPGVILLSPPPSGKLQARISKARPSKPFPINSPNGRSQHVVIPGNSSSWTNSFDVGVSVDVAPGPLFRTNIITISPRYIFVNRTTNSVFLIRQLQNYVSVGDHVSVLALEPGTKKPFWASLTTNSRPYQVQLQVLIPPSQKELLELEGDAQTKKGFMWETSWSSGFCIETILEKRSVVPIQLPRHVPKNFMPRTDRYRLEVREGDEPSSLIIELMDPDDDDNDDIMSTIDKAGTPITLGAKRSSNMFSSASTPTSELMKSPGSAMKINDNGYKVHFILPSISVELRRSQKNSNLKGSSNEASSGSEVMLQLTLVKISVICSITSKKIDVDECVIWQILMEDMRLNREFDKVISSGNMTSAFIRIQVGIKRESEHPHINYFRVWLSPIDLQIDESFVYSILGFISDTQSRHKLEKKETGIVIDALNNILVVGSVDNESELGNQSGGNALYHYSTNKLVYFEKFFVSKVDLHFSFQQPKNKSFRSQIFQFSILKRAKIRIDNTHLRFASLSLHRALGTRNMYISLIRNHYETEARAQILDVLRSVTITGAEWDIVEYFATKLLGSTIESNEFPQRSLSNAQIVSYYGKYISTECNSQDQFLYGVRNLVFDWRSNHTGMRSTRCLIVALINRSIRHVTLNTQLHSGASEHILTGSGNSHQLAPGRIRDSVSQIGDSMARSASSSSLASESPRKEHGDDVDKSYYTDTTKEEGEENSIYNMTITDESSIPQMEQLTWIKEASGLLIAWGGFSNTVHVTVYSNAFECDFHNENHTLKSKLGFTASFMLHEVSPMLCVYVLVLDGISPPLSQ